MRKTLHEYVIEQYNTSQDNSIDRLANFSRCFRYAKLTNRPPKLGDFIPCDEDGNVLEEPEQYLDSSINDDWSKGKKKQYKAAKDRVIFKGDWRNHVQAGQSIWITNGKFTLRFSKEQDMCLLGVAGFDHVDRIEDLPCEIELKDNLI